MTAVVPVVLTLDPDRLVVPEVLTLVPDPRAVPVVPTLDLDQLAVPAAPAANTPDPAALEVLVDSTGVMVMLAVTTLMAAELTSEYIFTF